MALALSVAVTSAIKANLLSRLLAAQVNPLRWPLIWAALAAGLVGAAFTLLPDRLEWLELAAGEPAIAAVYLLILWRWAFAPADRALFGKMPETTEASLANEGGATR